MLNRNSWEAGVGYTVALTGPSASDRPIVKDLRYLDYWCSQRIQFPRSVSFPHWNRYWRNLNISMGISAETGGYHHALFDFLLLWIFWLVEYDAIASRLASEQRKMQRVIPKIGIVTGLRESADSNPFFPRRQELRFKSYVSLLLAPKSSVFIIGTWLLMCMVTTRVGKFLNSLKGAVKFLKVFKKFHKKIDINFYHLNPNGGVKL